MIKKRVLLALQQERSKAASRSGAGFSGDATNKPGRSGTGDEAI
jgi:hypothetical protein